jgi:thymidylate kinase
MGVLISLSGIDGAGKSTQVELLLKYFRSNSKKIIATEFMFGYFILNPLIRVLRSVTGSPSGGPVKRNSSNLAKLWFVPAFIDIWLGYFFRTRPLLSKYDFIIADRFYTDIWANLSYYGYQPSWAFELLIKLLPTPDIAFMLSVDPATVRKREDDFPDDYYKEQAKIYKHLAEKVNIHVVDANQDPKAVFNQIKLTIVEKYKL